MRATVQSLLLAFATTAIACSDSSLGDCEFDPVAGCVKKPDCGTGPNQSLAESTHIAIDEAESFANFSQDGSFVGYAPLTGSVYLKGGFCPGATCPVEFTSLDLTGIRQPSDGSAELGFALYSLNRPSSTAESNGAVLIAPGTLEMAIRSSDDDSCLSKYQNTLPAGFVLGSAASSFAGGFTLANNREGLVDVDLRGQVVAP